MSEFDPHRVYRRINFFMKWGLIIGIGSLIVWDSITYWRDPARRKLAQEIEDLQDRCSEAAFKC